MPLKSSKVKKEESMFRIVIRRLMDLKLPTGWIHSPVRIFAVAFGRTMEPEFFSG